MEHSLAQTNKLTCPNCGQNFAAPIWLIIDASGRPELFNQFRAGTLHDVLCPSCGHERQVDAPLLLYRPDDTPTLIFCPAENTSEKQDQEQAAKLIAFLQDALGEAWQDEWQEDLRFVPHPLLPAVLDGDRDAAMQQMIAHMSTQMHELVSQIFQDDFAEESDTSPERLNKSTISAQQSIDVICPDCRNAFVADIWIIVDLLERPDLAEKMGEDVLHEVDCPNCQTTVKLDAPILVYQPEETPPFLFSPAQQTTFEQDRLHLAQLMEQFQASTKSLTGEEWLEQLCHIPRELFFLLFLKKKGGASESRSTLMEELNSPLRGLANFVRQQVQSIQAMADPLKTLLRFIYTIHTGNPQAYILEHPELLEEETQSILIKFIQAAHQKGNTSGEHMLKNLWALLMRCRERGVEQAFVELFGPSIRPPAAMPPELKSLFLELAQEPETPEDWSRRVAICRQALALIPRPQFESYWQVLQVELGTSLIESPDGIKSENIEQAILAYQQGLADFRNPFLTLDERSYAMNRLGNAYRERIHGERGGNIEKAISCYQQILEVVPRDDMPAEWSGTMMNLGNAYLERIEGERADNIEQAIDAYGQAEQVRISCSELPGEEWLQVVNNLANAYAIRIKGNPTTNVERAIAAYKQVLHTPDPVERAHAIHNLGNVYLKRTQDERANNIDQSISLYKQAAEIYEQRELYDNWAMAQDSLAIAYASRIHGGLVENIGQAIHHHKQALGVYTYEEFPLDWATTQQNLGISYGHLATYTGNDREEHITQAIHHFENALTVQKRDLLPNDYRRTQRNLGDLYFQEERWSEALTAYQAALDVGQVLLDAAYTEVGRQAEISEVVQLHASVAYCLWQINRPAEALRWLEQGKARLLAEHLSLEGINLSQLPSDKQTAIQTVRQTIRALEAEMRLPPPARQSIQALAQAIVAETDLTPNGSTRRSDQELAAMLRGERAALRELLTRCQIDYPDMLSAHLDVPDLLALIPAGGALVAPFVTSKGSATFVIPHGATNVTAEHILPLPNLTTFGLHELLHGPPNNPEMSGWFGNYSRYLQNETIREDWEATIKTVTGQLWDKLAGPIHERLQALGLVHDASLLFMPQGGLGLLPLHAAWRSVDGNPEYFNDHYTIIYAFSGYSQQMCQDRLQQSVQQDRSLFVATVSAGDLPHALVEGEAVAALFPTKTQVVLKETEATKAACLAVVPNHAYVHFSSHGFYHWGDPLQSGLELADETLTLRDVIGGLNLNACRLITLSACETGLTDIRQSPDEYLGLPTGFFQAGAPAVISTLWAVNDLSTMLLIEQFYQLHLQKGLDIASALHQAQRWLRTVTAEELTERFDDEVQKITDRIAEEEALAYWYQFERMDKVERPFAHPYYWAAFTFTGA